ncbi:protein Hezron [Drosophila busckii]|uniref:protein Hezron n=1 Tax=Drosophila busckii TaxID=30019 RepID=UPI00083F12DD|nr:protein Hezron [Drosophila busckii]
MSYDPFPLGTKLQVETCFGDLLTGEVVTYEHSVKMLVLNISKEDSAGDKKQSSTRCIVNLDWVKDIKIIEEAVEDVSEPPAPLNFQHLDQRLQRSVLQRERELRSRSEEANTRGKQHNPTARRRT